MYEETFFLIVTIACAAFGVLNLILFCKIWGMTNNVNRIADKIAPIENQEEKDKNETSAGQVVAIILGLLVIACLWFFARN